MSDLLVKQRELIAAALALQNSAAVAEMTNAERKVFASNRKFLLQIVNAWDGESSVPINTKPVIERISVEKKPEAKDKPHSKQKFQKAVIQKQENIQVRKVELSSESEDEIDWDKEEENAMNLFDTSLNNKLV